jgi:hypothetical protein
VCSLDQNLNWLWQYSRQWQSLKQLEATYNAIRITGNGLDVHIETTPGSSKLIPLGDIEVDLRLQMKIQTVIGS